MFLVDQPYISDFFKATLRDHAIPVVDTPTARTMNLLPGTYLIPEAEAIARLRANPNLPVYTTSENAIGWIAQNLAFSSLPASIELFKNKVKFRELTRPMFPNFFFKEVPAKTLYKFDATGIPLPFIIKPTAGFFSMGVHKVTTDDDWKATKDNILKELEQLQGSFPEEVLNIDSLIIEECIEGEEFAVDAYFNANGEAVILSILRHSFASATDVGDRVYTTSKEIMESNLAEFTAFVAEIGRLTGIKNFPVHIELRRGSDGTLLPIEVNPMRFGGWCTTADLDFLAYGYNPYLYYYHQQKPDWQTLLNGKEGKLFSLIILDNTTGISADQITAFDDEKLLGSFEKPLELRKMDHRKYPVFGFLFTETSAENAVELQNILVSNLREFINITTE